MGDHLGKFSRYFEQLDHLKNYIFCSVSIRLVFANGECCQDWVKRLAQTLNIPRKAEDVFSLAFCAWTRDCDELTVKPTSVTIFPWWRKISNPEDVPLTGENLFRFEVNSHTC